MAEETSKEFNPILRGLVVFIFCLMLGSHLAEPIWSPSIFASITRGNYYLANCNLLNQDPWSVISGVAPTGAWLADVLIAKVFSFYSFKGLAVFELIVFSLLSFISACLCIKLGRNYVLGVFFATISIAGILYLGNFSGATLGLLLFVCLLFAVANFAVEEKLKKSSLFFSVVFLIILNNIWGQYSLYLLVLLYLFARAVSFAFVERNNQKVSFVFLASIAFLVLHPEGVGAYKLLFNGLISDLNLLFVKGFSSPTMFHYEFSALILLALIYAILAVGDSRFKVMHLVVGALMLISLVIKEAIPPVLIVLSCFVCVVWGLRFSNREDFPEGVPQALHRLRLHVERQRRLAVGVSWVMLCLVIVNIHNLLQAPSGEAIWPDKEIEYLIKNKSFPILHDLVVSPYVIYKLSDSKGEPQAKALYSEGPVNLPSGAVLKPSDVENLTGPWQEAVKILQPQSAVVRLGTPLATLLEVDSRWSLVNIVESAEVDSDGVDSSVEDNKVNEISPQSRPWAVYLKTNNAS